MQNNPIFLIKMTDEVDIIDNFRETILFVVGECQDYDA